MTQFYREFKKNIDIVTMTRKNHFAKSTTPTKYQNPNINSKFITSFHQKPEIFCLDPKHLQP